MFFNNIDKNILRELAKQVAEIAAHPHQSTYREMWTRHNRLEKVKPMVLVFPEGAWQELLPQSVLQCEDGLARAIEWHFRHVIYRWENLRDDNVIEPWLKVGLAWSSTGWGLAPTTKPSTTARGAFAFDPQIKELDDIKKLKFPELIIDEEQTQRNFEILNDAVGDILQVKIHRRIGMWGESSIIYVFSQLRGLEQMMLDMVDKPEWFHEVMNFFTEGTMHWFDQVEAYDKLDLANTDDYVGSGGVAYTDELPVPDFDGRVRLKDLWGFAEAQEISQVSPDMCEEFVYQYQRKVLARFGLNCFGCCEPVTDRMEYVKKIPNLRRVSISPWADLKIAAEQLQDKYIFSWKPNPAMMVGNFDPDRIRKNIREALEIADGCVFEMILKDTHTVENDHSRLSSWVQIANEETSKYLA